MARNASLILLCTLAAGPAAAQSTTMPQTPTCSAHVTLGCSAAWTDSRRLNDGNGDRGGGMTGRGQTGGALPSGGGEAQAAPASAGERAGRGGGGGSQASVRTPDGR